jgi:aldehyde:ferredoxin oxidoreductase
MPHGYHGRILHVYLDTLSVEVEEPRDGFYKKYVGGSALGMYYVLKHTPPKSDPLGPENTLVLAVGVLSGVAIAGQSRMTAAAKSPLTGAIGDSQSGEFFPAKMKFSGYDAIVLHGQAEKPVYLWVHNGKAELRPADHIWERIPGRSKKSLRKSWTISGSTSSRRGSPVRTGCAFRP